MLFSKSVKKILKTGGDRIVPDYLNWRKLQDPKGKYDMATIKEYSDGQKTFWKLTYHKYLKTSGLELPEDELPDNIKNRVMNANVYGSICNILGIEKGQLTKANIGEIFPDTEITIKDKTYTKDQVLEYLEKLELGKDFCSVLRARNTIFEYASCNQFDYFITLTIHDKKLKVPEDRNDINKLYKQVGQWFRDYKKKNKEFQYVILPEQHKKGGWHFHGLVKGIPETDLIPFSKSHPGGGYIMKKLKEDPNAKIFDWIPWAKKWGFNDIEPIQNKTAVEKYITKYVSKGLGASIKTVNAQMYYCSKGLKKAKEIVQGTYSGTVSANDTSFFDYVGDYCSVKTVATPEELETILKLIN